MTVGTSYQMINGLSEVIEQYDAVILDLWGVVHDGVTPYPSSIPAMEALKKAGVPVALLSNAPRRSSVVVARMEDMGIARDLYGPAVASGEIAYSQLLARSDPWYAKLGRRVMSVGPVRDMSMFEGQDVEIVKDVADADWLLVTGPNDDYDAVSVYEDLLHAAKARDLPMLCPNPDREVIRGGDRIICAGAIAARYEVLGGNVRWEGKPLASAYDFCLQLFDKGPDAKLLVVGDSLSTDVAGSNNAGLDVALVTGGIHAEELGAPRGTLPEKGKLDALLNATGRSITYAVGDFCW
ncbi:TIGR01459 family HAD-type hydrolase [Thalassospiraceae bacterium SW-3-3]|uniref:TIGR01459 family HAD-type hydrolase n=1 Tax=Thalassospira sp. MCCC 1A03138 TaxID=1470576 RepID=UPI000A1DFF2A|nr:TIGR01459 family HAD-type hydrolase [Thalassospira sp. MCCC 1A03138]OSQ32243.1 sugar phosphatase [Thalassospira sp. MCCC 1A03138]UKV15656.1 TIGR01459 family HAD-type hydrolase [Thalassospiraceae bacterium SW-3-3]